LSNVGFGHLSTRIETGTSPPQPGRHAAEEVLAGIAAGDAHHDGTHGRRCGQSQDVADIVVVAPAYQSPAAKATVAAKGDADVGPDVPQSCDEQFEDGGSVVIGPDVDGSPVGDEQLRAAGDVEGQEAIAVVVAVEEAAFLVAVDGIVGGVLLPLPNLEQPRYCFDCNDDEISGLESGALSEIDPDPSGSGTL